VAIGQAGQVHVAEQQINVATESAARILPMGLGGSTGTDLSRISCPLTSGTGDAHW
jgi:hypothetical protein